MKITILQKGGDRKFHKTLEEAAQFFASQLMSTRMKNTLHIRIAMRAGGRSKNAVGHVELQCNGSKDQKTFEINIERDAPLANQVLTLAHEMVHVEQSVSKRLQYRYWKSDRRLHVRWEGSEMGDVAKIPYRERPWEREAMSKEHDLAIDFMKHKNRKVKN